jgi:hypothetical protein
MDCGTVDHDPLVQLLSTFVGCQRGLSAIPPLLTLKTVKVVKTAKVARVFFIEHLCESFVSCQASTCSGSAIAAKGR